MSPTPNRPRLGELLIETGALLQHQLDQALAGQRPGGPRLGTRLLEDSVVDEDLLLKALSRQRGLPAVTAAAMREAPRELLRRVPGRLARRLGALPYAETSAGIAVAMRDPGDLAAEDELRFALGGSIVQHCALELRIYEAIDLHYGETAPDGYRRIWDRIHRRRHLWQGRDPQAEEASPPGPVRADRS